MSNWFEDACTNTNYSRIKHLTMLPKIIAKIATYRTCFHHYRTLRHTFQAAYICKNMLIESLPIRIRVSRISSSFWLSSFASVRLWIYWEFNRFYFTVENGKQFGLTQRLIVFSWLAPLAFIFHSSFECNFSTFTYFTFVLFQL